MRKNKENVINYKLSNLILKHNSSSAILLHILVSLQNHYITSNNFSPNFYFLISLYRNFKWFFDYWLTLLCFVICSDRFLKFIGDKCVN